LKSTVIFCNINLKNTSFKKAIINTRKKHQWPLDEAARLWLPSFFSLPKFAQTLIFKLSLRCEQYVRVK
jgi:hypothetical protein